MTKLQKILSAVLVIAMLVAAGAVLAQDETPTDEDTDLCTELRDMRGENPIQAALDELGLTRQDIRDFVQAGGTVEEFFTQNGIDVEALRAEHEAERDAAILACVNELEANATITSEQADQLRTAISEDTLRELLQSGEFDGIFPFGHGNGQGQRGHGRGHGQGFGENSGGQGFGNGFGEGFAGQGFGNGLGSNGA